MKIILPNSTIGIFGSGQLGRMFAIEARKMGYRVHTFSPDRQTPTGQVADFETTANYEDLDAVKKFAHSVDVITYEFENVPSKTIEAASEFTRVHPKGEVLHTTQNRLREKTFLNENNFPVARFRHIKTIDDLHHAVEEIGTPCVLKTAGFGYDGKGQTKIEAVGEIEKAFENLNGNEAVLEAFVKFEKEVSVVCARDQNGNFADYGVIENSHKNHILDISFAPAIVSGKVFREAVEITKAVAEKFDYVGTLCAEFFLTGDEKLIINELAPRPHNSGHLTFDAQLNLIKGGGGALFREKMVARISKKVIIIADSTKKVERLGAFKVPVEVVSPALDFARKRIEKIGGKTRLREKDGEIFITDFGNKIIDSDFGLIENASELSAELNEIEGVVCHGLFIDLAQKIIMGKGDETIVFEAK